MIKKEPLGYVNNFALVELIGEGKFGKVYLSCDERKYKMFLQNKRDLWQIELLACKVLPLRVAGKSVLNIEQ